MPLKNPELTKFTTQSPILASYSASDLITGISYEVFYGYTHKETTTLAYGIDKETLIAEEFTTTGTQSSDTFTKTMDLDFDSAELNVARTIGGTMKINFMTGAGSTATSNTANQTYVIFKLRKWDGSTETEIANVQSSTVSQGASNRMDYDVRNVEMTVPQTHYQAGEQIRITCEVWARRSAANSGTIYFAHDPQDKVDTTSFPEGITAGRRPESSQLKFLIPFRIDL